MQTSFEVEAEIAIKPKCFEMMTAQLNRARTLEIQVHVMYISYVVLELVLSNLCKWVDSNRFAALTLWNRTPNNGFLVEGIPVPLKLL